MTAADRVVLLAGGVGGARLAVGLARILAPPAFTIIVNTGDDFEHLGLHISPDLDTVMYGLAGIANPSTGWGIRRDTFHILSMVERLGGPAWFHLGDSDLAVNLMRTNLLRQGHTLTATTRLLCRHLGVSYSILPMSDRSVSTMLDTDQGILPFQSYFVEEGWQPVVHQITFEGIERAIPTPEVTEALDGATLIIIGPSNPFLSIEPILALPGVREKIKASSAKCIVVSPIIGGKAVKGPAAKLMAELGYEISPVGIAKYYEDLVDGIILDAVDSHLCERIGRLGIRAKSCPTLMSTLAQKTRLARVVIQWAEDNLS